MSRDATGIYSAWGKESTMCPVCGALPKVACDIGRFPADYHEHGVHFDRTKAAPDYPPPERVIHVPEDEEQAELDGVPTCAHDLLVADCRVYAIAEYIKTHPERRMMDVTVRCAHCRARFRFRAPGGLSPSDPRCSILGDILHCPIEPAPDLPLWDGKDPEDFGGGG